VQPIVTYGYSVVSLSKTAEKTAKTIEMSFGMRTRVDPRKHVLDGVHIGAT